jgi:hypothetical protein
MQIFSLANFKCILQCPFYHVPELCSFIAWKAILRRDFPWQPLCGRNDDRCSQLRKWKQTNDAHRAWWSGKTISEIWERNHQSLEPFQAQRSPPPPGFWVAITTNSSINWCAVNTFAAVTEFCLLFLHSRMYVRQFHTQWRWQIVWTVGMQLCSPWWLASDYRNTSEFTYIKTLLWY